jgi:hypothetical protein
METRVIPLGIIDLAFVTSFTLRYNDKGSGASMDGAFWQPMPPTGFHALGGVAVRGYQDINGTSTAICVRGANPDAVAFPTDYQLIWSDKGSGADMDGSCWRPIPPQGYTALGDIFAKGYNKPAASDMVCLRTDLIIRGALGVEIYNDKGSGASMDIDVYQVTTPNLVQPSKNAIIAANTYVANNCYQPPYGSAELNCLCIPVGAEINQEVLKEISSHLEFVK